MSDAPRRPSMSDMRPDVPQAVTVSGAGRKSVNGTYTRKGDSWSQEGAGNTGRIYYQWGGQVGESGGHWYLAEVSGIEEVPFYSNFCDVGDVPPKDGWHPLDHSSDDSNPTISPA